LNVGLTTLSADGALPVVALFFRCKIKHFPQNRTFLMWKAFLMKLRMFTFIYIKKWIVLQIFTVLSVSC
jgi:hypothetical protein